MKRKNEFGDKTSYPDKKIRQESKDLRGPRDHYPDNKEAKTLDSLTKVFCTPDAEYTSIIMVPTNNGNTLYLSQPEGWQNDFSSSQGKKISLSQEQTNELKKDLDAVLSDTDNINYKENLLLQAYYCYNPFVQRMICEEFNKEEEKIKNNKQSEISNLKKNDEEQYNNINKAYQNGEISKKDRNNTIDNLNKQYTQALDHINKRYDDKINNIKNKDLIKNIAKNSFYEFLSNDELKQLKQFKDLKIKKVPPNEEYQPTGVHVEAQGVHYASTQHKDMKKVYIGLVKKDMDPNIGCCGGCTMEFKLLERKENNPITVHRTGDYPESRPEKNYSPSPLITDEEKKKYFQKKEILTGLYILPLEELKGKDQEIKLLENEIEGLKKQLQEQNKTLNQEQKTEISIDHEKKKNQPINNDTDELLGLNLKVVKTDDIKEEINEKKENIKKEKKIFSNSEEQSKLDEIKNDLNPFHSNSSIKHISAKKKQNFGQGRE